MKRRTFLQLLLMLPLARFCATPTTTATPTPPVVGQFVFDGVNGLTFPARKRYLAFLPFVRRENDTTK